MSPTSILYLWRSRFMQRNALRNLNTRFLRDIGKTREQAVAKAGKPLLKGAKPTSPSIRDS